jgi:hypothetical protein
MITSLLFDTPHGPKGTPVRFCDFLPGGMVEVELSSGEVVQVDAGLVSSGIYHPEETLSTLAKMSGIREDTLLKAAQSGRLLARRSGATWLSTINAVEWAVSKGKIRR